MLILKELCERSFDPRFMMESIQIDIDRGLERVEGFKRLSFLTARPPLHAEWYVAPLDANSDYFVPLACKQNFARAMRARLLLSQVSSAAETCVGAHADLPPGEKSMLFSKEQGSRVWNNWYRNEGRR